MKKKPLYEFYFLKKNDDASVANSLLNGRSPSPKTPVLRLQQHASLRSLSKLKAVLKASSDQCNRTRSLRGEVSGYCFPHKKTNLELFNYCLSLPSMQT